MERQRVHELLSSHEPADEAERRHLARMLELLQRTAEPFSRDQYVPGHFTASSFVLSPDLGSVLLILHGKLHRWLQPGGHVDPEDESLFDAACRELREETGLRECLPLGPGILDVDVHPIPARATAPEHEHFDVRFLLKAASTVVRADSDASGARWVSLHSVGDLESDDSVLRAVDKIRRRLSAAPS